MYMRFTSLCSRTYPIPLQQQQQKKLTAATKTTTTTTTSTMTITTTTFYLYIPGYFVDKYGRKWSIIGNAFLFTFGALVILSTLVNFNLQTNAVKSRL